MINYNNLFFKTGNLTIEKFDFFKGFGAFHDLLRDLLNEEISSDKAVKEQNEMITKVEALERFILLEEKIIMNKNTQSIIKKTKTKAQRNFYFFCKSKKCFKKCIKLYDK